MSQTSDTVWYTLSARSGSLTPHRFDTWKVMRWIVCLSGFYIDTNFPRSHTLSSQPATTFESTGMLNIQLSEWQKFVPGKAKHGRGLCSHTSTRAVPATSARKSDQSVGRSVSSLYLASGFSVSHQQGNTFQLDSSGCVSHDSVDS